MTIDVSTYLGVGNPKPFEEAWTPVSNEDAIEGYISLEIGTQVIFDWSLYDNLVVLWGTLLNELPAIRAGRLVRTSFPDQPIPIEFEPQGQAVLVRVGHPDGPRVARVGREELASALEAAGLAFFRHLPAIAPGLEPLARHYLERAVEVGRPRG